MAYQPKSYRKFVATAATAAVVASAIAPAASAAAQFSDVTDSTRHAKEIYALVDAGIISGYEDGTFRPNAKITRGEAAIMIARALDLLDGKDIPQSTFPDVKAGSKAYEAIVKLAKEGIVSGFEDGTFRPNEPVTRAQMAKYLTEAYDLELGDGEGTPFPDVNGSSKLGAYVEAVYNAGIADGYTTGLFGYNDHMKRGDFAKMVYNAENPGERNPNPEQGELKIASVTALNDTNQFLKIEFSKAVTESLETSDIEIKDAKKGDTYGVKAVTLAKDRKSATVELYQAKENENVLQYLTDYTITVKVDGKTLTATFNRAAFLEDYVVEIDAPNRKFTILQKNGSTKTIEVLSNIEGFDYQEILGEEVRIWYDDKNRLVKFEIPEPRAKTDAIEVKEIDEIKLLTENKTYDVSDDKFEAGDKDDKFTFYVDGKKEDITKFKGRKFNHAKVGFDDNGEVIFVSAYNLETFLVVDKIEGDEVVGIEGEGTGGSFDAEDATIIKDGKVIQLSDLKQGDILFFNNDANNDDGFAEVYNKTVTGEIEEIFEDGVKVGGKVYDFILDKDIVDRFALNYGRAVYVDENGKTKYIDTDAAEDLQAAGEVTLHLDRAGNLVYIGGDLAEVEKNTYSAILTDKIIGYKSARDKIEVEALLSNGKEKVYDINLKDLDKIGVNGTDYKIDNDSPSANEKVAVLVDNKADGNKYIALFSTIKAADDAVKNGSISGSVAAVNLDTSEGQLVKLKLDDDENLKKIEFFTENGKKEGSDILVKKLEADDSYAVGKHGSKKLLSSTIVFDAKDDPTGFDPDDIRITTWGQYRGSDINKAHFIYDDDNEVVALVITHTDSDDYTYEEAVVTKVLKNKDGEVIQLTGYVAGKLQTLEVDKIDGVTLEKGQVAYLKIDDNSNEVKEIYTGATAIKNAADSDTPYVVYGDVPKDGVDVGAREVTLGGKVYKLASDGLVIDARDKNDIKIKSLTDLRDRKNVTAIMDEKNSNFVKFFVYGAYMDEDTTAPDAPTNLTFEDTDLDANEIGGVLTFTASASTNVDHYEVVLGDKTYTTSTTSYNVDQNTPFVSQIKVIAVNGAGVKSAAATINVTDVVKQGGEKVNFTISEVKKSVAIPNAYYYKIEGTVKEGEKVTSVLIKIDDNTTLTATVNDDGTFKIDGYAETLTNNGTVTLLNGQDQVGTQTITFTQK